MNDDDDVILNTNLNYSYVTYISNDRDYKGVLLLNYNLKKYNHKYNLSCIVLENVSQRVKNILTKSNILLHDINLESVLNEFGIVGEYSSYIVNKHYYGKFLIFKLPYDKIVFLDSDVFIRQNIDNLFLFDTNNKMFMTYDVGTTTHNETVLVLFKTHVFNSGVIITEPSIDTYNKCYTSLKTYENNINDLGTDQTILNALFANKDIHVEILPFKYNYITPFGNKLIERNIIDSEPIIIHFILQPKPWYFIDNDENILGVQFYRNSKEYFNEWIHLYIEMIMENFEKTFNHNKYYLINFEAYVINEEATSYDTLQNNKLTGYIK
jgi:lipopolysaccharide biosynthesis glycosyltransferase